MNREARKKIKILIVDHEPEFTEHARKTLSREGYRVQVATGFDGVGEAFREDRYQIILLDLNHPENGGMALVERLREIDNDTVLVGMTASPTLDEATTALRAGIFDYRTKSLDSEELLELIAIAIKQKGLVVDFEKKINLEIGKKMRHLRKERGLTLKQLANRTGLSISLISQIERAKSSSSVSTLYKVASALSVKLEHFFLGL